MNPDRRAFLGQAAALATAGVLEPRSGDDSPDDVNRYGHPGPLSPTHPDPNNPDLERLAVALHEAVKLTEVCLDGSIGPEDDGLLSEMEEDVMGIHWNLKVALGIVTSTFCRPCQALDRRAAHWAEKGY